MKFGFRVPSLRKRIAARTSWKRVVRHSCGFKALRGWGWLTNPRRAAYNRIYNRTTIGLGKGCLVAYVLVLMISAAIALVHHDFVDQRADNSLLETGIRGWSVPHHGQVLSQAV